MTERNFDIPLLGLLSSLAAILQISAGIFPGIGHFLSIFGTLPIVIASKKSLSKGIISYVSAGIIIFIIQPQEAPIFIFTTGLLGVFMGFGIGEGFNKIRTLIYSALSLSVGIFILSVLIGIPPFGGITEKLNYYIKILFYISFSSIYSYFWLIFSMNIMDRIEKVIENKK